MAFDLVRVWRQVREKVKVDPKNLIDLWTLHNDARGWVVLGDPPCGWRWRRWADHVIAQRSDAESIHALLIGVDGYLPRSDGKRPLYPPLGGCVADVRQMEGYLAGTLGVPPGNIRTLTASRGDGGPPEPPEDRPTYENLVCEIRRLLERPGPASRRSSTTRATAHRPRRSCRSSRARAARTSAWCRTTSSARTGCCATSRSTSSSRSSWRTGSSSPSCSTAATPPACRAPRSGPAADAVWTTAIPRSGASWPRARSSLRCWRADQRRPAAAAPDRPLARAGEHLGPRAERVRPARRLPATGGRGRGRDHARRVGGRAHPIPARRAAARRGRAVLGAAPRPPGRPRPDLPQVSDPAPRGRGGAARVRPRRAALGRRVSGAARRRGLGPARRRPRPRPARGRPARRLRRRREPDQPRGHDGPYRRRAGHGTGGPHRRGDRGSSSPTPRGPREAGRPGPPARPRRGRAAAGAALRPRRRHATARRRRGARRGRARDRLPRRRPARARPRRGDDVADALEVGLAEVEEVGSASRSATPPASRSRTRGRLCRSTDRRRPSRSSTASSGSPCSGASRRSPTTPSARRSRAL